MALVRFFPVESRTSIVSLGEGSTPLIHATRLGAELNITRLYLKNDTVLPTGSLKDRSNSVGISKAKELGFTIATVMSTGNAAASVAAYSAVAGMQSVVMVPVETAPSRSFRREPMGRRSWLSMGTSITRSLDSIRRQSKSSAGMTVCRPTRTVMRAKVLRL